MPRSVDDDGTPGRDQRGIQSIEIGGKLLRSLAHHGKVMALKDLARDAGMPPAKAHAYLVSFCKLGLIEQDSASSRYGLGPLAMQLGLISMQQFDPVRLASPRMAELAQSIGHTVALVVWGNRGPTVVRIEEAPSPVYVNMRHGTVMSLRGTASGRLFAAYLPVQAVLKAMSMEIDQIADDMDRPAPRIDRGFQRELNAVRRTGLSHAVDAPVRGISAMAAPVFDDAGHIVLGLTAIGPSATFDSGFDGSLAATLAQCAADLSRQLGARDAL